MLNVDYDATVESEIAKKSLVMISETFILL